MNKKDVFGVLSLISLYKTLNFRKRLQKIVCIGKYDPKINYSFSFEFVRYHYGPFSFDLKNLMDKLIIGGFVKEEIKGYTYSYALTNEGTKLLQQTGNSLNFEDKKRINILWKNEGEKGISELTSTAKKVFGW